MKEMGIRPHFSNRIMQHGTRALGQSAVKVRRVQSSIFRRKNERPQALEARKNGKAPLDMRPGVVAAESALFVLSAVNATGALYAWDNAVAGKSQLKALEEQTPWTEVRIANASESQWTAAFSFVATVALTIFFGNRLVRMAQAKFGKTGEDLPAAKA